MTRASLVLATLLAVGCGGMEVDMSKVVPPRPHAGQPVPGRLADLAEVQSLVDRARPISLADWMDRDDTLLGFNYGPADGMERPEPDYVSIETVTS